MRRPAAPSRGLATPPAVTHPKDPQALRSATSFQSQQLNNAITCLSEVSHIPACRHGATRRAVHALCLVEAGVPQAASGAPFPRGPDWEVHKFGGTCVSVAERIAGVCDVLLKVRSLGLPSSADAARAALLARHSPIERDLTDPRALSSLC
jgi:hypothetical protein